MMRPALLLAACGALLALPTLASARGRSLTFETRDLSPREARAMRDPVLVDRMAMEQRLEALARELDTMRRELDRPRRRRGRGWTRGVRDELRAAAAELVALRSVVQRAHRVQRVRQAPPPPSQPAVQTVDGDGMNTLMQSLEAATFRDDKLRVLRQAAKHHHFKCAQVLSLAEKLTFGKDRIEAFVLLFPRVVDPENSHVFYGALTHGSDKEALDARLDALSR